MSPRTIRLGFSILFSALFYFCGQGQTFGIKASAVWLNDCNQSNFFNTSGSGADIIGPVANSFSSNNFGVHTQNSGTLILRGAELRTFKVAVANVCNALLHYRIYPQSTAPGAFTIIDLPLLSDCNMPGGTYPGGGTCVAGDQQWNRVIPDGTTTPYSPVDLTTFAPGNYVLEVYYSITGSSTSTTGCDETIVLNNGGANYSSFFSIQSPTLASNNPVTCNGTEGLITISGLLAGATYAVSYTDDGVNVGPVNIVANGSGQLVVSGLNAGVYANFQLQINGCTTELFTGIILSNPVFTPTFTKVAAFCAGSTPPALPNTSNNGISGSWNPAVINNQASGSYTFTPAVGQCGTPTTMNVTVIQKTTPTFSFGGSLTICSGGAVPTLPATSNNGIPGTWNPSVVDNQNSGVYAFTPNAGQCATPTTFTVTVNPNITPTFSFGTALTICENETVPTLPASSSNGINGTWSPATVNNQTSGTYTFTPDAGQCALPTTFDVTVTPNITPTFGFGTTLTICENGTVPTLPGTSDNGITGTWNPSSVSNQASATYTFTPSAGQCALPTTFTVTVTPNITPTFGFGTTLTICENGTVPTLPASSSNGINGTWNPATVSNQASATYTFTPDAGQCALPATFTVTVNPNITPTFGFGTALTICENGAVPTLPANSSNGINGTWSPATVSNQTSGTYTFTPDAGQCALPTTFDVTVTPNVTPTFSFGTTLTICENGTVPTLPGTSDNGITGTWNPSTVSNQASATYTFTPSAGQCALLTTFTVTVTPNITPTFDFGTTLTICENGTVPALTAASSNGINGTWNPATVSNQASATYTFTPDAGQCALPAIFTVTVNPNITPTFSFGTALTICENEAVPMLPASSSNGITGTWNPAIVSNQTSGTYTFTPDAGQCALPATFDVTVTLNITPTFGFGTILTICENGTVPTLPGTSDNGITGTWNPATVSNQASATYTFTPSAGQCALSTTFTVTVTPNITPTFDFGTTLTICENGSVPALTAASSNGINGTWNPATVSNQVSATYTFTPDAGQCALPATFTVTVNPNITPTFSFGTALTICENEAVPTLPASSSNGITGTWSPATVSNQTSGTYTFTPDAGQCALPATFDVTVTPNITPTFAFGTILTICENGSVPAFTGTSDNGITGTWNPSSVSNQASATYTFTPSAGQCALPTTFTVTVTPNITPTFGFGTTLTICENGTVPTLPASSSNGINGTWNPATVSNQASATYTFTPDAGQCALPTTLMVTVNPNITPTFSFGTALTICENGTVPTLSASSSNGITGTWNPATVDNQTSGTYTFTPDAGQCALSATFDVTVTPNVTPVFSFGTTLTICENGPVPALIASSTNGITGTWNPATVSNLASTTYTFTPDAGQCALPTTFAVTVNPNITPTFTFGTTLTVCENGPVPALVTNSSNGITGTWSPATVSNQTSGTYTFTPDAGQCALSTTFTVTVNPIVTPIFDIGTSQTICSGSTAPSLPATSSNGITGTWNPATADNQTSGTYTFTPDAGQCAVTTTFTLTVTPSTTPLFSIGSSLTICTGGSVPTLPSLSDNGINGTWNPAVINNQASGTYVFTPDATPEQCINKVTFTVTVKSILTPTFSFGTSQTICNGATAPVLPATSTNGITGTWSPAVVSNQSSGVYKFTPAAGQCATANTTFTVTVNPVPTVSEMKDTTVNDGNLLPMNNLVGTPANATYNWTNSNSTIGLGASGSGNIPAFTAINRGNDPVTATITVTPVISGCAGTDQTYHITVKPLDKDVFVPNVFTPNNDGKNDLLCVYGNYIDKLDMRIFNQWGEQVMVINNRTTGWDGTYRGKPQPVGVYVYVLQATLADGRTVKLKGSITLMR